MLNCKFCQSPNLIKRGFMNQKQRYKCKSCNKHHTQNDKREKYDKSIKSLAIIMRIHSNGFRNIAKILSLHFDRKIPYQTIVKWIEKEFQDMKNNQTKSDCSKEIPIMELDELYTFFKKKTVKSEYGLLLIETGLICVRL